MFTRRSLFATALGALAATSLTAGAALADDWNKLIGPAELAALQSAGDPLVVDIRRPEATDGGPSYAAGHVPGAVSAPYGRWRGPADNPGAQLDDAALTELLQSIGAATNRPTVVVYQGADSSDFGGAARVYWTLKSAGIEKIAILNGGVNAWTAADKPLSTEAVSPERSAITASLSKEWLATRDDVKAIVSGEQSAALLDARPMSQHIGLTKHKAAKAGGTLPGSTRFSQAEWFNSNSGAISPAPQASAIATGAGVSSAEPVVSFCNTGHWAATNWFALSELAGYDDVKLYPGSMVDWTGADGEVESITK